MENEITQKRGLILILVIATVVVFIGLVWIIATYIPWNSLGDLSPRNSTNTPQIIKNCTHPTSYWMEHPELYPLQIIFGSKVYQANEIREILTQGSQDPVAQLQAQIVGAFLNISSGADQTLIETTIFQAYSWLIQHPQGSEASSSEIEIGLRYFSLLEAYNLGLAGVAACTEGPAQIQTDIPMPSETAALLLTVTPSQTPTLTSTGTPSPTGQLVTPVDTLVYQTPTPIPTTQSPGGQHPTITGTNAATPTNTPIKTTKAPTSTKTPTKEVTATYTQSPPPTSTPITPSPTPPILPTPITPSPTSPILPTP